MIVDNWIQITTFTLSTSSANIFLLAQTLSRPGVALLALTAVHVTLARFAVSVSGIAVISRQTRITMPPARVTQTCQTLASDVVTVAGGTDVFIGVTSAGLTIVSDGQWVAKVTIGTTLTMSSLISMWTRVTRVFFRGQGIFIIIYRGNLTCWTKIV